MAFLGRAAPRGRARRGRVPLVLEAGGRSQSRLKDKDLEAKGRASATTTIAEGTAAFHGVRYLVADVKAAIDFYTTHLGFKLEHQQLPAFATVALGPLKILLSGPAASGSRPLPGGEPQRAGGSNRVVLRVKDLPAVIEALRGAGMAFRNAMETGPGGRQIQLLDPDGNPVELFEPGRRG